MKLFLLAIGCTLVLQSAAEKQTKVIPLDQIWAYNMPGTRDVRDLEPKPDPPGSDEGIKEYIQRSLVWRIGKSLGERPKEGEKAGPAFVVVGTGKEALENAAAIIAQPKTKKQPPNEFPSDTELSLVFYSHSGGSYKRLASVERAPGEIIVRYQPIRGRRSQQISFRHLALIPLGKVPEGQVAVKIVQMQSVDDGGQPIPSYPNPERFVSHSSSFIVKKQ